MRSVFTIRNEKNGDRYSREDVLAVSDTYGCVNQIKFHGRSFAGEDISNYKVVRTGDIVYTKSPLQAKPYGIIKIVGEETGIISPLYVVNETIEGIDPMFMYYLFDTPERTNNYLSPLVRKGAKNTMNISNEEWLSGIVTISPNEEEQRAIGNYFKSLDNLITLHQRSYNLEQKSKTTNAWEQRELRSVFTIRNEKNGDRYSREDVLAVSDTYGCVNQIKFHGRSFAGEDISNYKVVRTGDIVYTKSPLQAKPYGIIKIVGEETGIISPLYVVNETIEGIDPMFMYYLFDTPERTNNYLSPLVRKGAKNTMNISNEEWLSGIVTISPNEEEQRAIGNYFKSLDNLITLHQRNSYGLHLPQGLYPSAIAWS